MIRSTLDFFLFNCLNIIHDIRTGINEIQGRLRTVESKNYNVIVNQIILPITVYFNLTTYL